MNIKDLRILNLKSYLAQQGGAAKVAKLHDGIDASYLSQLVNKHRPFGEKSARRMEGILNLPSLWFDIFHASASGHVDDSEMGSEAVLSRNEANQHVAAYTVGDYYTPAFLRKNKDELPNFTTIPLMNSQASMGVGNEPADDELVIDVLRVSKQWIDRTLGSISGIANLAFIHGIGDSMSPTFSDGDILLVDTGIKSAIVDGVFVLEAHNRLFIKRVRQRIDGHHEISSDNPTVKTVDVLNGDHQVLIRGRVVWVWNGKKI